MVAGCVVGSRMFNDGNWHFAVVTGDAASIRGYVDGGLEVTRAASSNAITDFLYIGGAETGYDFIGTIDQVRLYGVSLTAQAIEKLYAEGRPAHVHDMEQS